MFSLNDQRLKERLLREANLTLEKALDLHLQCSKTAKAYNSGNEYNRTRKCNTCSEQGQVKTINNGNRDENNKLRMAKIKERIRCAENVESLILRDSVQHLECHDESVVSLITMPRCVSLQKPHIKKKNSA